MTDKEKHIAQTIAKTIHKTTPDASVILFGSHARNEATDNSDWDILILLEQKHVDRKTEMRYRDAMFDVALKVEEPISTFVLSKIDWETKYAITPLYKSIQQDGIEL